MTIFMFFFFLKFPSELSSERGKWESLLSIETINTLFSFREKERGQDKARAGAGARQAKASQGRARQGKPRARQALPVSCLALSGESLLSIETIKRLFSCIGKERDGKARQGAGAGQAKAGLACVMPCLAPGSLSLLYRNNIETLLIYREGERTRQSRGMGQGKPRQARAEQGKPGQGQGKPCLCHALPCSGSLSSL